jgi:HSP20 family protein
MRALIPFSGLTTFRRDMDRLFDRFFEGESPELRAFGEWVPSVDVSENKDKVIVKAEIPGIEAKDLEVSISDGMLTIKGEKKEEKEEKGEHFHRSERAYGTFVRTLRLPASIDGKTADATFKNGVLTITAAKSAAAKGTTIPVKAAA